MLFSIAKQQYQNYYCIYNKKNGSGVPTAIISGMRRVFGAPLFFVI